MAGTKIHDRQIEHRSNLPQLSNATKPTLKTVLPSVDEELTPLFKLAESVTPDLILNIGAGSITNTETSRTKAFAPINKQHFTFTSGTITFPASSGGAITVSPGTNSTLTVGVGNYIKVLVQVDETGNLSVVSGTENVTEAGADVPAHSNKNLPIGYVVMHNTGGIIDNVVDANIKQFVGRDVVPTDGDVVGTTDTQTLTNKTLTTPNINEAVTLTSTSTELNQLDGVTVGGTSSGDIVDLDTAQTLTNKALDAVSKLTSKEDTEANLTTYAITADNGEYVYATDTKKYYGIQDSALIQFGSGAGSSAGYALLNADNDNVSNWTETGSGTFAISATTPLNGDKSYLFTTAAQNDNVKTVVTLNSRNKEKENSCKLVYTSDAIGMEAYIYDVTNATEISGSRVVLSVQTTPVAPALLQFFVKDNATTLELRIENTHVSNTPVMKFDDVEFSDDPFVYKNLINVKRVTGAGNGGGTMTANVTDVDFTEVTDEAGAWNGSQYTVPFDADITISGSVAMIVSTVIIQLYKNGTLYKQIAAGAATVNEMAFGITEKFSQGDVLSIRLTATKTLNNSAAHHHIEITAQAESEHVITPAKSNIIDPTDYTPTFAGFGTVSNVDVKYSRLGKFLILQGKFTSGTPTAVEAQMTLPIVNGTQLTVDDTAVPVIKLAAYASINVATTNQYTLLETGGDSFLNFGLQNGASAGMVALNGSTVLSATQALVFTAIIPITQWSSDATFIAAIPPRRIAYFEDQKPNSNGGGNSLANTIHTRVINTFFGDTSFASLNANQILLQAGKYRIRACAPSFVSDENKIFFYNVTATSYTVNAIQGVNNYAYAVNNQHSTACLYGVVEITEPTLYELRHYITTNKAVNGLGLTNFIGITPQSYEIYTQVEIEKLK